MQTLCFMFQLQAGDKQFMCRLPFWVKFVSRYSSALYHGRTNPGFSAKDQLYSIEAREYC